MNTEHLAAFAAGLGALPAAVEDVVRRAVNHFGDTTPDPETLTAWGQQLRAQCTHLFVQPAQAAFDPQQRFGVPPEVWAKMTPEEHFTRARAERPPAQRQKTGNYIATADEQKAWGDKSLNEQLTLAHERTQQQREQQRP
jgi:hypothetical protein